MKLTKEVKVGIVSAIAIAFFIYGFNFLKGRNLFSTQRKFYAFYNNIDGLVEANPLMVNGYKIGTVGDIELITTDSTSRLLVTLFLDNDLQIPKNSIARVISSDILGSKAVQLMLGDSKVYANDGDTLNADSEDNLKESVNKAIAPLQHKAEGLIASMDSVMVAVQSVFNTSARQNLAKSFESIKLSLLSLETTSYRLDTLVISEKQKLSSILTKINALATTLASNSDKIGNIINNFSNISDSIAKSNLTSAINNADLALSNASNIMNKINRGEGTMGMLINNDSLYKKLDKSAADLDKLLIDLRLNPKRYIHFSVFGRKDKNKPTE